MYPQLLTVTRGCVTPKQIENLKSECEDDLTLIDGYDELDDDWKEKVSRAVEQGHVDDEDWKHGKLFGLASIVMVSNGSQS